MSFLSQKVLVKASRVVTPIEKRWDRLDIVHSGSFYFQAFIVGRSTCFVCFQSLLVGMYENSDLMRGRLPGLLNGF